MVLFMSLKVSFDFATIPLPRTHHSLSFIFSTKIDSPKCTLSLEDTERVPHISLFFNQDPWKILESEDRRMTAEKDVISTVFRWKEFIQAFFDNGYESSKLPLKTQVFLVGKLYFAGALEIESVFISKVAQACGNQAMDFFDFVELVIEKFTTEFCCRKRALSILEVIKAEAIRCLSPLGDLDKETLDLRLGVLYHYLGDHYQAFYHLLTPLRAYSGMRDIEQTRGLFSCSAKSLIKLGHPKMGVRLLKLYQDYFPSKNLHSDLHRLYWEVYASTCEEQGFYDEAVTAYGVLFAIELSQRCIDEEKAGYYELKMDECHGKSGSEGILIKLKTKMRKEARKRHKRLLRRRSLIHWTRKLV